jgi:hypothetical protein
MSIPILPLNVGIDASVSPTFQTAVNPSEGGISGRSSFRDSVIRNYTYNIGPDQAAEVYKIFLAVRGRRYPVALRDWGFNYIATNVPQTSSFMTNTLTPATGTQSYTQRILVPDTNFPITVNGSPATPTAPGIISGMGSGDLLTCHYLIPVCFVDDILGMVVHARNPDDDTLQVSLPAVHFEEVLEVEYRALTGLPPLT